MTNRSNPNIPLPLLLLLLLFLNGCWIELPSQDDQEEGEATAGTTDESQEIPPGGAPPPSDPPPSDPPPTDPPPSDPPPTEETPPPDTEEVPPPVPPPAPPPEETPPPGEEEVPPPEETPPPDEEESPPPFERPPPEETPPPDEEEVPPPEETPPPDEEEAPPPEETPPPDEEEVPPPEETPPPDEEEVPPPPEFSAVSFWPENGASDMATDTTVSLTFSSAVDPQTVTTDALVVSTASGTVPGNITVDGDTLRFAANQLLPADSQVTVTASESLADLAGVTLSNAPTWQFATAPNTVVESSIPMLQEWADNMVTNGQDWGEYLNPATGHSLSERLNAQYYDAQYVFQQIADYTGQTEPWHTYAEHAELVYLDEYLVPNNYNAQGYRRFPHGIYHDFMRGDDASVEDLQKLRDNPGWSRGAYYNNRPAWRGEFEFMSREVAYAIQAHTYSEMAGLSRVYEGDKASLHWFVEFAASHLHEWRTQTFSGASANTGANHRFAPFMFGLTAHALIEFYEWEVINGRDPNAYWPTTHWPNITAAIADVAAWAFTSATVRSGSNAGQKMWVADPDGSGYGAFRYEDHQGAGPARDLNLLVAPAYAWVYKQTGDTQFRDMGDAVFAGGVYQGSNHGYWGGKQFNQSYRLSFSYVEWRHEGDAAW